MFNLTHRRIKMKKLKIIKNGRHKFNILDLHLCKQFLQCRKKILRTKDFLLI